MAGEEKHSRGFSFGLCEVVAAIIKKENDDGFGDKNAGENGAKNMVVGDFFGDDKTNDDVSNEKNNGGENFGAEDERKALVVGFFGAGFTKSVMVKIGKKSGCKLKKCLDKHSQ